MADEVKNYHHHESKTDEPCEAAAPAAVKTEEYAAVESSDRGLFDFLGKKEEEKKCEEEVIATEFEEKVQVCEEEKKEEEQEKKHEGLLEKLHRSNSSSSSSSDEEEVEEGGEKKKKKKGLKEKIKDKLSGEKKEEEVKYEDTAVPIEKCDDAPTHHEPEEKKFLDKIKEKLPAARRPRKWPLRHTTPPSAPPLRRLRARRRKGFWIR
ncbi:UNVERIFIED_CONTAM: hypothetical protein Slati_2315500 [Sesamum latifolium]|uniref:Dehydrin n=1 Tax=Sesamum latifolium TaxID=2727402 RepID=A0AAW2W9B7_9LAMI